LLLIFLELDSYKLIESINATWHIFSPNLMLLYGSYMKGTGLKWRHLFFWYTLSCFDLFNLWRTLHDVEDDHKINSWVQMVFRGLQIVIGRYYKQQGRSSTSYVLCDGSLAFIYSHIIFVPSSPCKLLPITKKGENVEDLRLVSCVLGIFATLSMFYSQLDLATNIWFFVYVVFSIF
jgi:hypothetical protein